MRCIECRESGHFKCTSVEESLKIEIDFNCTTQPAEDYSRSVVYSKLSKKFSKSSNIVLHSQSLNHEETRLHSNQKEV